MAQYAVITGSDTEAAGYADDIAAHAEDHDIHVFDANDTSETVFAEDWSELEHCRSAILLGGVGEDVQDYIADLDIPVVSEEEYDGTLPLAYQDRVGEVLWGALEEGPARERAEELKDVVSGYNTLAIGIHDNPDPDAISSAIAMQRIADHYGVEADVFYGGDINHQENKALKNKLSLDLINPDTGEIDWNEYDGIALLDTGLSNISIFNAGADVAGEELGIDDADLEGGTADDIDYDALADETITDIKETAEERDIDYERLLEAEKENKDRVTLKEWLQSRIGAGGPDSVDIVIDHHPSWEGHEDKVSGFYDVRTERGATAAIMAEYFDLLDIDPGETVATALVHGIRTDTGDLDSSVGRFVAEDVSAFAAMFPYADTSSLAEIESSTKTAETFDTVYRAWNNKHIDGATLFSYVGDVEETDAIPQTADEFLDLEGVQTTIISGLEPDEEQVRLSVRSGDIKRNVGEALDKLFGEGKSLDGIQASYGGDDDMGGARIPLDGFLKVGYSESGDNDALHNYLEKWLRENVADPFGKDT